MKEVYRIERGDPSRDRERVLEFWRRANFFSPDRARRYDWFYVENPTEPARIYLMFANADGSLVGTGSAATRMIRSPDGRVLKASVLVDFAVDPAHRSVGPALALQRFVREQEFQFADLLYGLPDVKAVPVFRRIGSDQCFQEGSYVYVIRTGTYLARRGPPWAAPLAKAAAALIDATRSVLLAMRQARSLVRAEICDGPPRDLDAVWAAHPGFADTGVGVRDESFLSWRFSIDNWNWVAIKRSQNSSPIGYIVFRREKDELHIGDLLLPPDPNLAGAALRAFLCYIWKLGVHVARLDLACPANVATVLSGVGFSLRGARPCFVTRNPARPAILLPNFWWLTRADEDV